MEDYRFIKKLGAGGQGTTHQVCRPRDRGRAPRRVRPRPARDGVCRACRGSGDAWHAGRTSLRPPCGGGGDALQSACVSCGRADARARQARRTTDGQMFVIKQVLCGSIKEANDALKEAKVLQRLAHTGIVKYEDVFLHEVLRASSACVFGVPRTRAPGHARTRARHPPRVLTRKCQATEELGGAKKLGVCIVMELCEMGDLTARLKVAKVCVCVCVCVRVCALTI